MSSKEHNDQFSDFILVIIAVLGVGAVVIYALTLFWPYFVFYILPFVAASVLVGGFLRFMTAKREAGHLQDDYRSDDRKYFLMYNYKSIAVIYPVLICITLVVFHLGSERRVVVDKKGVEQSIMLEWPRAHQIFNKWRESAYADSWFDSLNEKAHQREIYDRREMGRIAWLALFLGGPLFFFWLSRKDQEEEEMSMYNQVALKVKRERESLKHSIDKQEEIIEARSAHLRKEISKLERQKEGLMAENLVLKARVEFTGSEVPRPLVNVESKGVLDKDIL
jgi:hypothetical protein